jgi:hypothetical protein
MSLSLPLELILVIFDLAASASTGQASTLCLVATWVRDLAERHMYSTFGMFKRHQIEVYERLVSGKCQSCHRQARHVRNLWLDPTYHHPEGIPPLHSIFPNLRNLVCGSASQLPSSPADDSRVPVSSESEALYADPLRVQEQPPPVISGLSHLAINNPSSINKFDSQILSWVTHLRLGIWSSCRPEDGFSMLTMRFPNLTHLTVNCGLVGDAAMTRLPWLAIREQFNLEMLVLEVDDRYDGVWRPYVSWVLDARRRDNGIYLVPKGMTVLQKQWLKDLRSGDSVWERAKVCVEQLERSDTRQDFRAAVDWKTLPGNEPVGRFADAPVSTPQLFHITTWAKKHLSFRKQPL